ncbi:hydroxymethylbilane synthase [Ornithobacterium rhinotracheale]|uniref:hydroxymethylbilane synthase n=1 Tax=Ornithobacterium rhinotracheale TaxID=28251 RepID=UPI004039D920
MATLKLGTRKSPLAMWQALQAQKRLEEFGHSVEIVPIASEGDLKLKQPIYELGITGVFTKALDIALVNGEIDLAVHSLKDVPTQLAQGLQLSACLPRGDHRDILVFKSSDILEKEKRTIATGSLRRKAFWHHRFPQDTVVDLRGNVQLRLQKLLDNDWDGAIFAYAGLNRSEILQNLAEHNLQYQFIENMISAPSQGIVGIVTRQDLDLSEISDTQAQTAGEIERAFLRKLEGGCTAPIGGYAHIENEKVHFSGAILSLDGTQKIEISETRPLGNAQTLGEEMAQICLDQGAGGIIQEIKKQIGA